MHHKPLLAKRTSALAKLFGEDPEWEVKEGLRRFKRLAETGEVITTVGQPAGATTAPHGNTTRPCAIKPVNGRVLKKTVHI